MLKTITVALTGNDAGTDVTLTELPALVADRAARAALLAIDEPPDGGVVAFALEHLNAVRALGRRGLDLLQPFLGDAQHLALNDWRSVRRLHNAALLLHAGFLMARTPVEIPVRIQALMIARSQDALAASFCSAQIATVILSGKASYRELETALSTEDVHNIVELLNLEALRALLAAEKPTRT